MPWKASSGLAVRKGGELHVGDTGWCRTRKARRRRSLDS
jgi:hypothetical protein